MNKDLPKGIIILLILIGLLFFLVPTTYKIFNNYKHKDYVETTATFTQSNRVGISNDGTSMYTLTYEYTVDGKKYSYETNYSTNTIPKRGSKIEIKYNPVMPSETYSNFDVFSVFQIIGAFVLFITLVILFSGILWLRDLITILFTGGFVISFLINKLYNVGFTVIIIFFGIICFASIINFIKYLKNNKFQPLEDIQKEIIKAKQIKIIEKEKKRNLSEEEINLKLKNRNKKIKGILLFIVPILLVEFIDVQFGFPNQIICCIFVIIAGIFSCIGFFTFVMALDSKNSEVYIAGKLIDNEDIKNSHNMTLIEKIKAFNIIRTDM